MKLTKLTLLLGLGLSLGYLGCTNATLSDNETIRLDKLNDKLYTIVQDAYTYLDTLLELEDIADTNLSSKKLALKAFLEWSSNLPDPVDTNLVDIFIDNIHTYLNDGRGLGSNYRYYVYTFSTPYTEERAYREALRFISNELYS